MKENITDIPVSEVLKSNFMPYAMSVIVSRAIPEIDGLKPSHRKVLYTMYEMGLLGSQRTKSANIAARTLLLNPHSDQSQYETMVRMTQNRETLLTPLVDGKGSFGKHYSRDTAFASARYTEAKLMPVANEFFKSIKKNAVDFVDNYDSTRKEPVLLPVTFPNILANPTEGIAVGVASSIPSFNLSELCEATIERIKHPKSDLLEVMPGPDFTTGSYLLWNEDEMKNIYKTGKGSITLRSKYTVDTKSRIIEVSEIPYTTTAEAIIENVISLIKAGKITEITDIRNEIGLHGFRLAIDYKRGADPEALMKKLFSLSKLQDAYSFNMTILSDGSPKLMGVYQILDEWTKWRESCIIRELTFDCEKKESELHLLEGLEKIDIDKAIKIIRKTEKDEDVIPALMKSFKLSELQAIYVSEIKLRNLNKDYILNKTKTIQKLKEEIEKLQKQIKSDKEIKKIIIKELKEVQKKYGIERKTEILKEYEKAVPISQTIEEFPVNVYITEEGYVKKIAHTSLKGDAEIKFKEGDTCIGQFTSSNSKELLVFSDRQAVYKVQLSELKNSKPSDVPEYIYNFCDFEENEKILHVCTSDAGKNVLIGFKNGKVAKFPLNVYETKQNRKKLLNAYGGIAEPLKVYIIDDDEDFAMESSKGKILVFNSEKIPLKTTKSTQGVQTLRLAKNVTAVSFGKVADYNLKDIEAFRSPNIPAAGNRV